LKATIRQVLDWTIAGGVTMKGVSIMEVGGYFANNATLHEKAPEVDTSNVSVGVYDPALADNPSLVQWTADLFDKASTMNNVYTVADAGMQAGNYAFQAAMRLDAKYGNPVSNGVLNMSIQSHYFLQMGMVRGQEMIHSGMIKGQQAMNNRLASVANSPIAAKMNAFSAHMMTDPRLVYSNYYLNQARGYGSQAMNGVRHYGAQALDGMKQLGNQGMTMLSNTNQWFQGKLSDVRTGLTGISSSLADTRAVQGIKDAASTVTENKYIKNAGKSLKYIGKSMGVLGTGISILDNTAEFYREENKNKTTLEKTGRVAGGLAVDFGAVAVGAAVGSAFPVVGTVAGAVIGGVVAAGINLFTDGELTKKGRDLGEAAARKVGETVDTAKKKVGETVDTAKKKVDNFVSGVGNAIESGKQAVEKAGEAIATGKKVADAIGGLFSNPGDFRVGFGR
ncbi:hypothetical protein P4627_08690, partial [Halalkalibacterium halodurans]|nr:hypothetical protein [Halalkalibacterium halodurans]